jgi:PAS domain S-box-containing protein
VKLGQRMLLVFAATVLVGVVVLYFLSRSLLLSNFLHLETEQTKQNVEYAATALYESYRSLGTVTSDYAYWDRTYEYMADPTKNDISKEFQNGGLEDLGVNLIVIRDLAGKTVFAKAYDTQASQETPVPTQFLEQLFARPELQPDAVARMPLDGLAVFPDGPFILSTRPILTSARTGNSRGVLLLARRFDEDRKAQLSDLTHSSLKFVQLGRDPIPPDFQTAYRSLMESPQEVEVRPISSTRIGGYVLIPDLFGAPLFVLRVDTGRPIYARGLMSQRYMFAAMFCGAVLSSAVIFLFLQKYVVSRVGRLGREVKSIGKRKAIRERVEANGSDELSALAHSINGMLEQLEKSQAQFLFLTENIHQVFWIRDARTGAFEYISRAFETIWGRPRSTLAANPDSWQELLNPEDRDVARRLKADTSNGKPAEAYYRIISEGGTERWLWERAFPSFGPDNQLKQIAGLTEDITDFKRNEEALLHAHQELEERVAQRTAELAERSELVKLLVDSAPGALYGMDAEGNCTFCNPAGLRLLGYKNAEEIIGKNLHQLIHHTRADGSPYPVDESPIYRSFHGGDNAHVVDEVFWTKDGTSFPVEYSSQRIRRHGKVVGVVVSFLDITDRKRKEMELRHGQKLEAVGRLAAGIAHEINTPIQFVGDNTRFLQNAFQDEVRLVGKYQELRESAARGAVPPELLSELDHLRKDTDWDYLQEEIPRAMEQMLEGLNRVATIVRGMKEFSHVDRTKEKSPGDVNRALESTLIVARNELKYVADVETDLGHLPPVICHLGDLNQVFLNLLVNAAHAIEDATKGTGRKGKITVRTKIEGDWVEISIGDSGTGIPEEAREKIFDPFFTTKEVGKGTGQGLALARAIVVEKHHGTLTFETEMGKGTTFLIRLPVSGYPVTPKEVLVS